MKRFFLFVIMLIFAFALSVGSALADEEMMEAAPMSWDAHRNQVSFSLGVYYASDDFDDEFDDNWDTGGSLTATYTRLIGSRFAIEAGLHSYATTFDENNAEGKFSSGGVEALFLYVPYHGRIMPYVGGGIGSYSNHIEVEVNGVDVVDDEGTGTGLIFKGGVRAHMTERFFLGGFVKVFSNNQEVEYENGDDDTIDLGGTTVNFEVGFTF